MVPSRMLAALLGVVWGTGSLAAELVGVDGSATRFASAIESRINGAPVRMVLTGGALRSKAVFKVYAIGSYVEEGTPVRSAGELAASDSLKQMHLVMEREIPGEKMSEAFTAAIRQNHPAPDFTPELAALADLLQGRTIKKGDHIWLTHVPQVGMHCQIVGQGEHTIRNLRFSRAVWEIYLGERNLGEAIKLGLVSRLDSERR